MAPTGLWPKYYDDDDDITLHKASFEDLHYIGLD